jgi:ferritin-like metal-binding protein YciE
MMNKSNGNGQKSNGMNTRATSQAGAGKSSLPSDNSQLEKFFHDQLKDLYWAEKQLTKALPKMQKAATTAELKSAIGDHHSQTLEQITRLEQAFEIMGKKAQAKKCEAMEGLIKEGESAIEDTQKGSMTRDVAIIMSAQKVEHYEIASYGTLVQLAETMGNTKVAELLQATLDEEKQTDQHLSALAEDHINWEAESEEEEEEPKEEDDEDDEHDDEEEEDE